MFTRVLRLRVNRDRYRDVTGCYPGCIAQVLRDASAVKALPHVRCSKVRKVNKRRLSVMEV